MHTVCYSKRRSGEASYGSWFVKQTFTRNPCPNRASDEKGPFPARPSSTQPCSHQPYSTQPYSNQLRSPQPFPIRPDWQVAGCAALCVCVLSAARLRRWFLVLDLDSAGYHNNLSCPGHGDGVVLSDAGGGGGDRDRVCLQCVCRGTAWR